MPNYLKMMAHGTGMVMIMGALAGLVAYLTRVVLARNLTPEEYGLFSAVFTFISFFLFFRDMGIHIALVRYIPEFNIQEKFNEIKTSISSVIIFQLLSSSVLTIIFISLAGFLAEKYFSHPEAKIILILLIGYIFGSVFYRVFRSIFNGFQNIRIYSCLELIKNSATLLLVLIFIYFGFSLYAPVLAYALVCFVVSLILIPSLLKTFPFFKYKITNFWPITKKQFIFGLPIFATSAAGKFISDIDTLMLTKFRTLAEVGVYNVILPSATLFVSFSSSIASIIIPTIIQFWVKKDWKRLTEGLGLFYRYSFLLILIPILIILVFSDNLINAFFGQNYVSGALALQILVVGMALYFVAGINNGILIAVNKPNSVAKIIIFAALVNVIANLILIPPFGIAGAAIATSLSYLFMLIFSTLKVIKNIPLRFPKMIWLKISLAGVSFVILADYLKELLRLNFWFELIIIVVFSTAIYLLISYLLGVINIEEVKKYLRILIKK